MQIRFSSLLASALLPFLSGACVLAQTSDGIGLAELGIESLSPGAATRADVVRQLGPPDEVIYSNQEHDPLFERAFRYRREKTKQTALFLILFSTFRSETRWDSAIFFFDDRGVLQDVGVALDRDKAKYGLAW